MTSTTTRATDTTAKMSPLDHLLEPDFRLKDPTALPSSSSPPFMPAYDWREKQDEDLRRLIQAAADADAEASETEYEPTEEEKEEILNGCESPRQRASPYWTPAYQARRNARKLPPSPPSTPPHLKGRKLPRPREVIPELRLDKVQKKAKRSRVAPRRPPTRSTSLAHFSLHPHRKDQVIYWLDPCRYTVISSRSYMRNFDHEEFEKHLELPHSHNDRSGDTRSPEYQKNAYERMLAVERAVSKAYLTPWSEQTDHQREICRMNKVKNLASKKAVEVPWDYKGIIK